MKNMMILMVIGIGLMLSISTKDVAAVTLGFNPSTQSAVVGIPVDVAVTISGLGNFSPDSLSAFDLDVNFDASILGFSGIIYGDPVLGDQLDVLGLTGDCVLAFTCFTTPGPGSVNLFEFSFDFPSDLNTLQSGSFTLATLTFNTVGVGTSGLGISVTDLSDAFSGSLGATSVRSGSVEVTAPVPEPSTFLLLDSGLVGLAVWRRRHQV